jgi:hypothetical protein
MNVNVLFLPFTDGTEPIETETYREKIPIGWAKPNRRKKPIGWTKPVGGQENEYNIYVSNYFCTDGCNCLNSKHQTELHFCTD